MEKKLIIFLDSGDTLMDESTEVYEGNSELVLSVDVIPGADTMIKELHRRGFTLAIVADGLAQSFKNAFMQHGIYECFTSLTYSELVRQRKPSPHMFKAAIGSLNLTEKDIPRIVMVGNNLARDIAGANALGITSVHLTWTSRYPKEPANELEVPDYSIAMPMELVELAEQLNEKLEQGQSLKKTRLPL